MASSGEENTPPVYSPLLRKARGVWYTPQPLVSFIVSAVDDLLRTECGLADGLAGTCDVVDPATGTGIFLAETIRLIRRRFRGSDEEWQRYVERQLLPRLHGFEVLRPSCAMTRANLVKLLAETGCPNVSERHLNIRLANSLERQSPVKEDCSLMVVVGNPPYCISSQNKGAWMVRLLDDYKQGLNERNVQPLSDDYVKFMRLAQHYVQQSGKGIVGYVTNNSYLDGIIHRQMRKNLLEAFDRSFILNLHGDGRRQETAPDGSRDENVFGIKQGVCVSLMVKNGRKPEGELGRVFYRELFGKRQSKCDALGKFGMHDAGWQELSPQPPYYFFVPKDTSLEDAYRQGFRIDELFVSKSNGVTTSKDIVNYWSTEAEVRRMVADLLVLPDEEYRAKYHAGADSRHWSVSRARADVEAAMKNGSFRIVKVQYRPFSYRYLVYTGSANGIVARPRYQALHLLLHPGNISLIVPRQTSQSWRHVFASECIADVNILASANSLGAGVQFPLYKTASETSGVSDGTRLEPNLNQLILSRIEQMLGEAVSPEELFHYIYAVLHSPNYRSRYMEMLRVDFPRVPYPTGGHEYHRLARLGSQLRQLHTMHDLPAQTCVSFPQSGSMRVDHVRWADGRVHVNATQYFDSVPEAAWRQCIGGYQPALKWLKDRKGTILSTDDIAHYQRVIYVLQATARLIDEIDSGETLPSAITHET